MAFEQFVNLFSISKTLRFELRPIGRTLEKLDEFKILDGDMQRAVDYPQVKILLDEQHKSLLERALESKQLDACVNDETIKAFTALKKDGTLVLSDGRYLINWTGLADSIDKVRIATQSKDAVSKREATDEYAQMLVRYRRLIATLLEQDVAYADLTGATPKEFIKTESEHYKACENFTGFATFFTGFQENRKNIYKADGTSTAASTRLIDENFAKFYSNVLLFKYIAEKYPEIITKASASLVGILKGQKLDEIFRVATYSSMLTQRGIDAFNRLLGGYTLDGGEKIQGLNELINLYKQQHEEVRGDRKLASFILLYKQILSDRTSASFIPKMFSSDKELKRSIEAFVTSLKEFSINEQHVEVVFGIAALLRQLTPNEGIFVDSKALTEISKNVTNDWSMLPRAMEAYAENEFKTKKAQEAWLKQSCYSLAELSRIPLVRELDDGPQTYDIMDAWSSERVKSILDKIEKSEKPMREMLARIDTEENFKLREAKDDVSSPIKLLKAYLDAILELLHLVKPLATNQTLGDLTFYASFDLLYRQLSLVLSLYDCVRNYMTQKCSDEGKIKLMFTKPTLASGWDISKEQDNFALLFEKDGLYYLGILNGNIPKKKRPTFMDIPCKEEEPSYNKMIYKYVPGPNKMLPKVFFSEKGKAKYKPSEELLERYNAGCHTKGANFDLAFCHQLIDFFKLSIQKNEDWAGFNFKFSPTATYQGIDGFYREFEEQNYSVSFKRVPACYIQEQITCGNLFFFQIYNKDFAKDGQEYKGYGRKNLHTLYWESIFSAKNLEEPMTKLNGGAELFYRKAQIEKPYAHEAGEKVVNRRLGAHGTGEAIPEAIHLELVEVMNNRKSKDSLSSEAKLYFDSVITHPTAQRLIKDRRYTETKFSFHVPITLNCHAAEVTRFNDFVNDYVREHEEMNIIGIDRGERNLIYVTVITSKGELLYQRSFNQISGVDYHNKLDTRENERQEARKNWATINKIADLKKGYLSAVVHEITKMMINYHAIVVMEDLNFGFKQGRFYVEKQVYQDFEKMLIDKLNYLTFKPTVTSEQAADEAQLLHDQRQAYQLTSKFESFSKLGKQSGFLYYVPAAYTSKIDPTTGFTNLFNTKSCTNTKGRKEFLSAMKAITYDQARDAFAFSFDYNDYKQRASLVKSQWTVYSADLRIVYNPALKQEEVVYPTQRIKALLDKEGIVLQDKMDLLALIKLRDDSKANAQFFSEIYFAFSRSLQMRNSSKKLNLDYIDSPVLNKTGTFYTSREVQGGERAALPQDADANGAFHIALKGLMILKKIRAKESGDKLDLKITNEEWFAFTQTRND